MIGITSFAGYVPRLRLGRQNAVNAMDRPSPDIARVQKGERSVCSVDEDALTMAHEAARSCLAGDRTQTDALYLCSTTLPFADRQNATILKTALGLGDKLGTADLTGSLRAGTTGLIAALSAVKSGDAKRVLVAASDHRLARPGSPDELTQGDGAAALLVGDTDVVAEFLGSVSISRDLPDHFRGAHHPFDYRWEDRWSVDTGLVPIVQASITALLDKIHLTKDEIDLFVIPAPSKVARTRIAGALDISPERMADDLLENIGDTGAAHPLLMISHALETKTAGQTIICVGIGGGADALCFKTQPTVSSPAVYRSISRSLENREELLQYAKFLTFRGLLDVEQGIRGEIQTKTALSVLYRERDMLIGLDGGNCEDCSTPQFPKTRRCVNPACRHVDTQVPYSFADRQAVIRTFTGDYLLPSLNPPSLYGLIQFDGGGRMHSELCDCTLEELDVGTPVRMVFRKRYEDHERGFTGYFWKATPSRIKAVL